MSASKDVHVLPAGESLFKAVPDGQAGATVRECIVVYSYPADAAGNAKLGVVIHRSPVNLGYRLVVEGARLEKDLFFCEKTGSRDLTFNMKLEESVLKAGRGKTDSASGETPYYDVVVHLRPDKVAMYNQIVTNYAGDELVFPVKVPIGTGTDQPELGR